MPDPCLAPPLIWEDGLIGVDYDSESGNVASRLFVNEYGELSRHPYLACTKNFSNSEWGGKFFDAVGTVVVGNLFQPTGSSGWYQILETGSFGTFTPCDDFHQQLIFIETDARFSCSQITESDVAGGANPFFVDASNSVIMELQLSTGSTWQIIARSTMTADKSSKSVSWFTYNQPAVVVTGSRDPLSFNYRIRWICNSPNPPSGGWPSGVGISGFGFKTWSLPFDRYEGSTGTVS